MHRRVSLLYLVLVMVLGCATENSSEEGDVVRVSVNSWVGFAPLYIARDEGIFARNGLTVEISKTENAPDRRAALIAGRVDLVGSTIDDLAVSLSQGVDALAVACADYSNGGDAIIGAGQITSLDKLDGHQIAVQPGFVNHFFLLYVLDSNGISTAELVIQPMTPDDAGAAFITGSIDAAVTWEPHISQALKQRPGTIILASSKDYPEAILDIFIANRKWYEANGEVAKRFQKSWDEALTYLQSHPNEAAASVANELELTPADVSAMLMGAKLLRGQECRDLLRTKARPLTERVQRLWKQAGYLKGEPVPLEASLLPISR